MGSARFCRRWSLWYALYILYMYILVLVHISERKERHMLIMSYGLNVLNRISICPVLFCSLFSSRYVRGDRVWWWWWWWQSGSSFLSSNTKSLNKLTLLLQTIALSNRSSDEKDFFWGRRPSEIITERHREDALNYPITSTMCNVEKKWIVGKLSF